MKIKPYDKKAALDSLARIHGLFNDNVTLHPGEGGSLEERLAAGRKRLNAPAEGGGLAGAPDVIESVEHFTLGEVEPADGG